MIEKPQLEKQEKPIELSIIPPQGDKHHMVAFTAHSDQQADRYNDALDHFLSAKNLRPFHQVGSDEGKGYHAWELWGDVDEAELQKLFPIIHKTAEYLGINDLEEQYKKLKEIGYY